MSFTTNENGNMVRITPDSLQLNEMVDFVTDPSAGGISIFLGMKIIPQSSVGNYYLHSGTTRDHFKGMGCLWNLFT